MKKPMWGFLGALGVVMTGLRCAVDARECDFITFLGFLNLKSGATVFAREDASSDDGRQERRGVPARDEHAMARPLGSVPLDRDAMCCVLRRQAENLGEPDRAKLAEADEADPDHTDPIHEMRPEPCVDHVPERARVDSIVDEKTPFDRGCNIRNVFHSFASPVDAFSRLWRKTTCSGHTADRKLPTETARRSATSE